MSNRAKCCPSVAPDVFMATSKKFTDSWLKSVTPPQTGRDDYTDTDMPGLRLRVTSKGAKSFSYAYRYGAKTHRVTLGRYPALSLKDARIKLLDAKVNVQSGQDPRAEKKKEKTNRDLTVALLADEYIELYQKPKNKTWNQAEDNLRLHILPAIGHYPIHQVERSDIHRILDRLVAEEKGTTANRVLAHTRKFFNWLVERDYLEIAPTDRIKQPAREKKKDRVLSDDELRRIVSALPKMRQAYADFIRMLLFTAQRREEVASMRHAAIDEAVWRLEGKETKNKKATLVPLARQARAIVAQNNNPEAIYVFSTNADHATHVQSYSKIKKQLDELSGVTGWSFHDIRRTVATRLAAQGLSIELVRLILNHTDNSVTAIYNRHSYMNERREALQTWCDWLEDLAND